MTADRARIVHRSRAVVTVTAVLALLTGQLPWAAAAHGGPTVTQLQLVSASPHRPGDEVVLTSDAQVYDAELQHGVAVFVNESGDALHTRLDAATGRWTVPVTRFYRAGTYVFHHLELRDTQGRETDCYADGTCREFGHTGTTSFSPPADVVVVNDELDREPPRITQLRLITPAQVTTGDDVVIASDAADRYGLSQGTLVLENALGRTLSLALDPATGSFRGPVGPSVRNGVYVLDSVGVEDTTGLFESCTGERACSSHPDVVVDSDVALEVVNSTADVTAPTLTRLERLGPDSYAPGDTIVFDSDVADAGVGLAFGSLSFEGPRQHHLSAELDPATGQFVMHTRRDQAAGPYRLTRVQVEDRERNEFLCYGVDGCEGVDVSQTGVLLEGGFFPDYTAPQVRSVRRVTEPPPFPSGSQVRFHVELAEPSERVQGRARVELSRGMGIDLDAEFDPATSELVVQIPHFISPGTYTLAEIYLSDAAGNDTTCTAGSCYSFSTRERYDVPVSGLEFLAGEDDAPPEVYGGADPQPNAAGWHREPFTVHWYADDSGFGLAGPAPDPVQVADDGRRELVTAPVCDLVGNCAVGRYRADLDTVPPVVSGRADREVYDVDQTVTVTCSGDDELSGLASCTGTVQPALWLPLGTSPVDVYANDVAGNSARAGVPVTLTVTYGGLRRATSAAASSLLVGTRLTLPLLRAELAPDAATRRAALEEYRAAVRQQSGRALDAEEAENLERVSHGLDPA
jgi:hypothetical protein